MKGGGPTLDEGWLVWVAAAATGLPPDDVLATADIGALVGVVAEVELTTAGSERAIALLRGIARRRPFATDNRAAAWLACVIVLDADGVTTVAEDADVVEIVDELVRGSLSDADALVRLTRHPVPAPRVVGSCPACGRPLHLFDHERLGSQPVLIGSSRYELVARCWFEHRVHDRSGRPFAVERVPLTTGDASLVPA